MVPQPSAVAAAARPSARATSRPGATKVRAALLAPVVGAAAVLSFETLPAGRALVAAFVAVALVVLSVIDIRGGIIPNRIVLPASAAVVVAQIALSPHRTAEWLIAGLLAAFVLALPQLLGRGWMGMGDAKLALLIGVALGWGVVGAVLVAFVCAFPVALLALVRGGLQASRTTIPFGPFLSLGALIVLFGPPLAGLPTS
jgi:prepilin signal peptidase PulO-like enzyme (type II secretory pathway)